MKGKQLRGVSSFATLLLELSYKSQTIPKQEFNLKRAYIKAVLLSFQILLFCTLLAFSCFF